MACRAFHNTAWAHTLAFTRSQTQPWVKVNLCLASSGPRTTWKTLTAPAVESTGVRSAGTGSLKTNPRKAKIEAMTPKIIDIVTAGLQSDGFGGLVQPGICGCLIGDLSPARCLHEDCQAGYKHTHSIRLDEWIVSLNKHGVTDADIERCIAECG